MFSLEKEAPMEPLLMCELHIHEPWSLSQLSAGEQQGASLSSGLILGFPGIH